jgi:hypothetical protein
MTVYTKPERVAERAISRRLRSLILRDPCAHCRFRQQVFEKSICSGAIGRTIWACISDGKTPSFELDETTIGSIS